MQQTTAKEAALNIFAILGFIALLIAGLWSTIQLIQIVFSFAGSHFVSFRAFAPLASLSLPSVAIALADSTVTPGKPFTVGWSGANVKNTGVLTFTYACREGLFLKVQASIDTEYAIPCNAPYAIPKDASSLSVTPVLSINSTVEVPLTLSYSEGGNVAKDTASVKIENSVQAPLATVQAPLAVDRETPRAVMQPAPATAPVAAPVPKKTYTVENPVQKSDAAGFVNLEARIITVGTLNSNGDMRSRNSFAKNETASVTFEIVNSGTKAVQGWTYSLTLPTEPAYTHFSDAQQTLYAGSKATITISFDKLKRGSERLVLAVNPSGVVSETDRTDNVAQVMMTVQ